jgi:hypothetical protein
MPAWGRELPLALVRSGPQRSYAGAEILTTTPAALSVELLIFIAGALEVVPVV